MTMTTAEWVTHIDAERERRSGSTEDRWLAEGFWHAYGNFEGYSPMKGAYVLVRWERPTVAVSHDDPEEAKRLARLVESALDPDARATHIVGALGRHGLLITREEKTVAYRLAKAVLEP